MTNEQALELAREIVARIETPTRSQQPMEAATVPDALLRIQTVTALTGLSVSTIYRLVAAGTFPQPRRLGARCTRWRAGDVTAWLVGPAGSTASPPSAASGLGARS